jgi:hypothetical protein
MIAPALLAATMTPLLPLPLTGALAEAAYLKARFYADHYGKVAASQTMPAENSTTYSTQSSTTYSAETRPPNQWEGRRVMGVSGRMRLWELSVLVKDAGWPCWASNVKLNSLLMLIADAADRIEGGVFPFSRDRARLLCPSLPPKVAAAHNAPGEGLAALVELGVFAVERPGRRYPFARAAEYRFAERFAKRGTFDIELSMTGKQAAKWHGRHDRIRNSFEQKNPIIPIVRKAAARVEFSAKAMELLVQLPTIAPGSAGPAMTCYRWIQAPAGRMKLDSSGTLGSPISRCPRLIRPYLLFDREDVVEMDISGAHIALLTRIYEPEVLNRYRIEHTEAAAELERQSLIAQTESGDVYGGETEQERKRRKKTLLTSLNIATKVQMAMPVTQKLIAGRPILAAAMRAVKKHDHRGLSQWLQRWTSDIVNPAVLSLHERSIPSIPIVDGLMIRQRDAEAARDELASRLFASTGVRAEVRVKDMTNEIDAIEDLVTI